MTNSIRLVTCVLVLLAGTMEAQAFSFSFPFPGSSKPENRPPPGPGPWLYRPQEPTNARGIPPNFQPPLARPRQVPGQMPTQGPGYQNPAFQQPGYRYPGPGFRPGWPGEQPGRYGRQTAQRSYEPPRVELELYDSQPYVQENVLLKLRIVSDQNLATATPELPTTNDVLFQNVRGPQARSRTGDTGRQEIVNEFIYSLTPLRPGTIEVPPLRITGTIYGDPYAAFGDGASQRFEANSSETLSLQVRPAMTSVRPWLPLKDLSLMATLDGGEEVQQGQPVTLVLELTAVGATGNQLPSLESLLHSPDFRVYREQTLNEGSLSPDGRDLEGRRTEYYTLVPRSGGKLKLPEIRVAWWNVETGSPESAGLPIRALQADGETGPYGRSASEADAAGGPSWFWLPLAGLILVLLGYWGGVWYRGRPIKESGDPAWRERLGSGLVQAAQTLSTAGTRLVARLDARPWLTGLGQRLHRSLPPSTRFLMCVKAANREDNPADWAARFVEATRYRLQLDARTQLPGIVDKIIALRPGADREEIARLMQQLDGALYGEQDIDFTRWKRQFRSQVSRRRGLVRAGGRTLRLSRARLPELNPQFS